MPLLQEQLEIVEQRWLPSLYAHCRRLFSRVFLPSHDQEHHLRVWHHAKLLLKYLPASRIVMNEEIPRSLIIAAFFHDTGMILTRDEDHGRASRGLCEDWLETHPCPAAAETLLHAIEHHDDKSLKSGRSPLNSGEPPDLLSLLSVADDMDAFGYTGIYRYAEIYLMRGIRPRAMPVRILENLENRYRNMELAMTGLEDLMKQQTARYRITRDFFLRLAESYAMQGERRGSEPAIMDFISRAVKQEKNLLEPNRLITDTDYGTSIRSFFRRIDQEKHYFT